MGPELTRRASDDRVQLLLLNFTGNGGYVLLDDDLGWFCSCSATTAPACL
jgi:hypothetical protein